MIEDLEKRITAIEARNKKVELDKAWETSVARKISIACITYVTIALFFWVMQLSRPLVNAIVPTIGFLLSTISFDLIKKYWVSKNK